MISRWFMVLLSSLSFAGCTTTIATKPEHFVVDSTEKIYLTTKGQREIFVESGNYAMDTTENILGIRVSGGLLKLTPKRDVPYSQQKRSEPFNGVVPLDSLEKIETQEFSLSKTTFLVLGTAVGGFLLMVLLFVAGGGFGFRN